MKSIERSLFLFLHWKRSLDISGKQMKNHASNWWKLDLGSSSKYCVLSKILEYIPGHLDSMCQCVYKGLHVRTARWQDDHHRQNWQSLEQSQHYKVKKTQHLINTLYLRAQEFTSVIWFLTSGRTDTLPKHKLSDNHKVWVKLFTMCFALAGL